jgi:hypothetical protein
MKQNTRKLCVQVTLIVGLLFLSVSRSVSAQDVTVSGKACLFFAGQTFPVPSGTTGDSADYHGDQSDSTIMPPHIGVYGGSTISVSAEGIWGHPVESGPDGLDWYDDTHDEYVNLGGISRVIAPLNTLIGIFLADLSPDPGAMPASLNLYLGDDMTSPQLQQAFAIGSSLEYITVPEGATRLFFGLNDGFGWYNNVGSLTVTVTTIVGIDIKPETLNLKSKGKFTAFIELPEGYDEEDVATSTVACEGAPAVSAVMADNNKLIVKFNREDLVGVSTGDAVELTVTGEFIDGTPFIGSDTIRVIDKGGKK